MMITIPHTSSHPIAPEPHGPHWIRVRLVSLVALLSVLILLCAGCGGSPPPSGQATPVGTPAGTLLFQSDWTHGIADWKPTQGWTLTNGVLQSSTGDNLSLTLPYQPSVSNYAVEFRLLILDVPRSGASFALDVPPSNGRDGYSAGVADLLPDKVNLFARHPQINVLINPAHPPGSGGGEYLDFEHHFEWRTYRVEVRGNTATIYADGHRYAYGTSEDTQTLSTGPLQFECATVQLQLAWFRVYAL